VCITSNAQIQNCQAAKEASSVYHGYREKFPFHFQTVGLAAYPDSSRLFLISEPPERVTEQDIRLLFSDHDYSLTIKQNKLGYDGYIKDVLIVVNNLSSDERMRLTNSIHKLLFSTDYKAQRATIKLPVNEGRIFFSENSINYSISLAELQDWFIVRNELFTDMQGHTFGVKKLLKSERTGVFLSDNPGFVSWVINKESGLNETDARKFCLDGDLLLGAFSNANKLIIIARERESKLSELPPLNIGTILLLAATNESSLSQSLDMNDVLCGKIEDRGYDWCPTYLSSCLENTEYGDLLTVNDLLLKGWSESGRFKCHDVIYPTPNSYPFEYPLFDILANKYGQKTLVYNWNTDNSVQKIKMSDYAIYALACTGSLPVSYYNDQHSKTSIGEQYEKHAYEYFAESQNTDLARAVQYSFLYSVFYDNQIYAHTQYRHKNAQSKKRYLLEEKVKNLLLSITNSSTDIHTIAHTIAVQEVLRQMSDSIEVAKQRSKKEFDEYVRKEIIESGRNANDPDVVEWRNENWNITESNLNEHINQVIDENVRLVEQQIVQAINEVRTSLMCMTDAEFKKAYHHLSYPRGETSIFNYNLKISMLTKSISQMKSIAGNDIFKPFGVNLAEVMDFYSSSLRNEHSTWIKTPTLVCTSMGARFVGGHNVSAAIKEVASIKGYTPGFSKGSNLIRERTVVFPRTQRMRGL
jgi:hypothetical protein